MACIGTTFNFQRASDYFCYKQYFELKTAYVLSVWPCLVLINFVNIGIFDILLLSSLVFSTAHGNRIQNHTENCKF